MIEIICVMLVCAYCFGKFMIWLDKKNRWMSEGLCRDLDKFFKALEE